METLPTAGKVGSLLKILKILGYGITGTTNVSFNDTAPVFKVISKTLISATVPTGATTGFVTVTAERNAEEQREVPGQALEAVVKA